MGHASLQSLGRLWRYYQVGIVNTVFGYGVFALLVSLGVNIFVAQIVAHLFGVAFNYFSYSRHVFHDASASKLRFLMAYALNYFLGMAVLAAAAMVFRSPYIAGLLALLIASAINFLVLRKLVFTRQTA